MQKEKQGFFNSAFCILHSAFPQAAVPPSGNPSEPVLHTSAKPNLSASQPPSSTASASGQPAPPRFGHDPAYHWLVGVVEYSPVQRAWRLRYLPFEEDDRYGGCVTLVAAAHAVSFKPGQLVRVEGALIDPDSRQMWPAFEVQTLRAE